MFTTESTVFHLTAALLEALLWLTAKPFHLLLLSFCLLLFLFAGRLCTSSLINLLATDWIIYITVFRICLLELNKLCVLSCDYCLTTNFKSRTALYFHKANIYCFLIKPAYSFCFHQIILCTNILLMCHMFISAIICVNTLTLELLAWMLL